MSTRSLTDEILARALSYVDRRGGAGMRRGGRGRGSATRPKDKFIPALTNFSPANYFATQVGGGEAGDAAGFGYAILVRQTKQISSTYGIIANTYSSNSGHGTYIDVGSGVRFRAASAAGSFVYTPGYTFAPSDLGRLHLFFLRHNGTALQAFTHRSRQQGVDVPIVGYSPPTFPAATLLGALIAGSNGYVDGDIVAVAQFRGAPTQAQIDAYYDAARTLGDLPMTMQGATITHKWPDRALLKSAVGGTAPASLPDVVTGASVDAMARVGSPTVVAIDLKKDGRRSYGVHGFISQATRLQTANGAGIRGATSGFHVRAIIVPSLLSGDGYIAACSASSGTNGWSWLKSNATLKMYLGNASTAVTPVTSTIPAAWLHTPHMVEFVFDGANAWQILDGVASAPAAVAAGAFTLASAALPMTVGTMVGGSWPLPDGVLAISGAHTVPTTAESAAAYQTWQDTGKLPRLHVASEHYYDLTADVEAAGGTLPTSFLDRAGSDHLTKIDALTVASGNGITGITAGTLYQTPTGAGLPGVATGFWWGCLARHDVFVNLPRVLFGRSNMSNAGFDVMLSNSGGGTIQIRISDGTTLVSIVTNVAMQLGRIYDIRCVFDGAIATAYIDGVASGTAALPGYTPHTGATYMGPSNGATYAPTDCTLFGAGGAHTVPTPAAIAAAAAASLASGRFVGIAGTNARAWDIVQDVIDAGGLSPGRLVERMGSTDHMSRNAAPLQITQRTERVWSYEASPVVRGVKSLSQANHYAAEVPFDLDVAAPFWFQLAMRVDDQSTALATATRRIAGEVELSNGNGLHFFTQTRNVSLGFGLSVLSGGVTSLLSVIYTLAAGDVGKTLFAIVTSDATRIRLYVKRSVEVGNAAINGTPIKANLPIMFGKDNRTSTVGAEGSTLIGLACGQSSLSVSEVTAAFDVAVASDGDVQIIPGRTTHLWSLTREGSEAPAQITDRVGTMHLKRVGSPAYSPVHARSFLF